MKKILVSVLAVVLVFAFVTNAFASYQNHINTKIYGGPSQNIAYLSNDDHDNVHMGVQSITWNGQTDWKFRSYDGSTGEVCTTLASIPDTGSWYAYYTIVDPQPSAVRVKSSKQMYRL